MTDKKYDYTGKGASLPGIPARDLTDEDWEELSAEDKKLVRANAAFGDKGETKHLAIYAEIAPEKPAKKGS